MLCQSDVGNTVHTLGHRSLLLKAFFLFSYIMFTMYLFTDTVTTDAAQPCLSPNVNLVHGALENTPEAMAYSRLRVW